MRTSIPIAFIFLPTLCSLALFLYGLFSDRWVGSNFASTGQSMAGLPEGLTFVQKRLSFLKRLGLFRRCISYRWVTVIDLNSTSVETQRQMQYRSCMRPCETGEIRCGQCCVNETLRCDHIPECESYDDELHCPRLLEDVTWLDERNHCFKHRIDVTSLKGVQRRKRDDAAGATASSKTADDVFSTYYPSTTLPAGPSPNEHLLHCVQTWLLVSATILQFLILISLAMLNPCRKHLIIPFTFIMSLSLLGFLCSSVALGIFLWNWVHRKLNLNSFHPRSGLSQDAVTYRLNPFLSGIEFLDIAFFLTCGAVTLCLLQSAICLLFYCGITASSAVPFRKRRGKGSYEVVKVLPPYEDHFMKA